MIQRSSFHYLVLAILTFMTVACERDARVHAGGTSVDTLASGGLVVSNPATGTWGEGESLHVEEMFRIGALDGDGPDLLGRVGAIEVGPDGSILVFDLLAKELRIFSDTGVHHRTIGRGGAGPGEFQDVVGMALGPGGDLWIVDWRNARYTVLGRDGALESMPRQSRIVTTPWVGGFDRDGHFYERATEVVDQALSDLMLQVSSAGEVTGRFAIPRIAEPRLVLNGGGVSVVMPYTPRALQVWDPRGGVWQALSSDYRITNVGLDGDTTLVVSKEFEPAPLASAQADSIAAFARRIESRYGRTVPAELRPTMVSPLRWFTLDDEHRLWVCATGLDLCSELDLFDASGSFLGTVPLPTPVLDLPLPLIRGGRIYAAVEGEQGEPQVLVGRIVMQ